MNPERMLITGFSAFATVLLIALLQIAYHKTKTANILETTALRAKHGNWQSCTNVTDSWGRTVRFSRYSDETRTSYVLTSSGKDGIFGNKDDMTSIATDFNKSRIVGKWMGKKSKEFAKGVVEGIKESNEQD